MIEKCDPGTWFGVPLRTNGWAIGRTARVSTDGELAASYFFGPYEDLPQIDDLETLDAAKAVLVGIHSSAGLADGSWPVLGRSESEELWPIPIFRKKSPVSNRLIRVEYVDDDSFPASVSECTSDDPNLIEAPEDGFMGHGFVEARLTDLLARL